MNQTRADVADKLRTLGQRVCTDPRNVSPPCYVVGIPRRMRRAACGFEGELPIYVVVPGPGNADAVAVLLDLVDMLVANRVVPLGDLMEPTAYTPDPGQPTTYPAYELSTRITT